MQKVHKTTNVAKHPPMSRTAANIRQTTTIAKKGVCVGAGGGGGLF